MGRHLACFKAYDVRGKVPSELNPEIAYAIGRAYADATGARKVCIGYDIRLSGPELSNALQRGLNDAGVDVVRLGMVGTEMVYFATAHYGLDGGVMITASHNPPEYNGMKMVREGSRPISSDTGLDDIERRAFEKNWERSGSGTAEDRDAYSDFTDHLLRIVAPGDLEPLRILADPGNGAAGVAIDQVLPRVPLQFEKLRWRPDGNFPNGVPTPILAESREPTEAALRAGLRQQDPTSLTSQSEVGAFDYGVAWDGDYDRCFLFDGAGNFIEGYYIVGLLARSILSIDPGQTIIYDPRLYWNTLEIVEQLAGRAVVCKSGHAFIKEKMRAENAVYGGEMSAHHYFRAHWYCDSGMIPLLMIARLVSRSGKSLGELVGEMIEKYPCSGEVNSTVADVAATLARVEAALPGGVIDRLDGLSVEFADWRFNLRGSNTEPVIRLNVESRGNRSLMEEKTQQLLGLIRS